jgi:hypothetical protein
VLVITFLFYRRRRRSAAEASSILGTDIEDDPQNHVLVTPFEKSIMPSTPFLTESTGKKNGMNGSKSHDGSAAEGRDAEARDHNSPSRFPGGPQEDTDKQAALEDSATPLIALPDVGSPLLGDEPDILEIVIAGHTPLPSTADRVGVADVQSSEPHQDVLESEAQFNDVAGNPSAENGAEDDLNPDAETRQLREVIESLWGEVQMLRAQQDDPSFGEAPPDYHSQVTGPAGQ